MANMKEAFLITMVLMAGQCSSCEDKDREMSRMRLEIEGLKNSSEQLQKSNKQLQKNYDACQGLYGEQDKFIIDCKDKLKIAQSSSEEALAYFRSRAAQRVLLQTPLQQDRVKKLSLMLEKYSGGNPLISSYLEDNIYKSIQVDHRRWIEAFGYNPLNKQQQVTDPVKAILLYQGLAMQMLKTNGLLSEDQLIRYLDATFGDGAGRVIAKIPGSELEALTK